MNWQKDIVRATVEGAGPYPEVQLEFLLRRLEAVPGALDAIIPAHHDMSLWLCDQAAEMAAVADTEELFRRIRSGAAA